MAKLVLGILILGGAALLIFSGGKNKDKDENVITEESSMEQDSNKEAENQKDFEEKTTLNSLMKKGGNYECVFSHKTEVGESTGTVYISGQKIRGDFSSKVSVAGLGDMGDIQTHMISDGESIYSWSSMSSDGYKIPKSEEGKSNQENTNFKSDQELDYKCVAWSVDQSKFSLPTNITFKSI
ncbi:MAG: hypothetical protein R3B55_02670 [Candidatus Paceibacterota bacterium]